jgi:hypothetical protein
MTELDDAPLDLLKERMQERRDLSRSLRYPDSRDPDNDSWDEDESDFPS